MIYREIIEISLWHDHDIHIAKRLTSVEYKRSSDGRVYRSVHVYTSFELRERFSDRYLSLFE